VTLEFSPWPTAAEVNGGIRSAAAEIECPVCADRLREAAIGRTGDPVQRVEAAVVVATARIAAHVANGHQPNG
jgi:hypothetical protein